MSTEAGAREGTVVRKSEFAGRGAAIQLVGILLPIVGAVVLGTVGLGLGLIGLVILLIVGSAQSRFWICSECRNRVQDRTVRVCPVCRAELSADPDR